LRHPVQQRDCRASTAQRDRQISVDVDGHLADGDINARVVAVALALVAVIVVVLVLNRFATGFVLEQAGYLADSLRNAVCVCVQVSS
jgi:hypothetical protein